MIPEILLAFVCVTQTGVKAPTEIPNDKLSTTPVTQDADWAKSWWMPRHEAKLAAKEEAKEIDLLWIGDSITHSWENAGKKVWDEFYAERNAFNLGFSGDRTEHVLWRIDHGAIDGISPKLVVLMIGTNNTGHRKESPSTTADGIAAIIERINDKLPKSKVLLLGVFPRDEKPSGEMRKINDELNKIISQFDERFDNVRFLDIGKKFLDDEGTLPKSIMPDSLHPNAKGYRIWAEAVEPTIAELME